MKEYIEMLLDDMWQAEQETTRLHNEANALPYGDERDGLIRQWALLRGEVRGMERALTHLQGYLRLCQELME